MLRDKKKMENNPEAPKENSSEEAEEGEEEDGVEASGINGQRTS